MYPYSPGRARAAEQSYQRLHELKKIEETHGDPLGIIAYERDINELALLGLAMQEYESRQRRPCRVVTSIPNLR